MKRKQLLKGYKVAIVAFCTSSFDEHCLPICDSDEVPCALYDNISQGEHVLCSNGMLGIIQRIVENVDEMENIQIEVICKIDYENYKQRQDKLDKIEDLKRKMQKKKEELNELAIYQALAATSQEMADMLKELKELL